MTDHHGSSTPETDTRARARERSPEPRGTGRAGRFPLRLLVPLLVGLLTAGVVLGVASTLPHKYRATAYTVVVPADRADLDQAATLFDSLSRGQIVATASTLITQTPVTAAPEAQLTAGDVTPSAVIRVTVTATDPGAARAGLEQVLRDSAPVVNANIRPYILRRLTDVTPEAERVGVGMPAWAAVALVAGLVAAALAFYVFSTLRRPRD